MPEYIVELLVVVEADTRAQAEALGEQAAQRAWKSTRIKNVMLSDVRCDEDEEEESN